MSQDGPSPKLIRLDADIAAEPDPIKRGCLRGERAGLLARQGFTELARQALDSLHRDFDRQPDAGVSIWMQIAEGWMAHYNGLPSSAKDHLQRAYALSAATGLKSLQALSAAWLAHLAYSRDSFSEMVRYLRVIYDDVSSSDHATLSRSSLVLAQSFHFSNRFDLAQPWYLKARSHAMADRDDPALSVLSYNMSGRRAFYLVEESIFGKPTSSSTKSTSISIDSSQNFDRLFRITVANAWGYVVQAMACSALEEFAKALSLYEVHLAEAANTGLGDQLAFFKADMAWCHVNLGRRDVAASLATESAVLVDRKMYVEDKAIALGRLGQVHDALGNLEMANDYKDRARAAQFELQTMRNALLQQIISFAGKAV